MKRKIVIIVLVSLLLIMGTIVFLFINSIKEDQQITKAKAKEIIKAYEKFNDSINQFAILRETYYQTRENTFLEEFAQNYDNWNKLMKDYEQATKKIEKNSKFLKENCIVKFADINVQNKCTTFKANYEAAMNYYITDIKNYNKTVQKYSDWIKENNYNYGKLNKAKYAVYKKYIDFDKDGEYFGKEEVKNG